MSTFIHIIGLYNSIFLVYINSKTATSVRNTIPIFVPITYRVYRFKGDQKVMLVLIPDAVAIMYLVNVSFRRKRKLLGCKGDGSSKHVLNMGHVDQVACDWLTLIRPLIGQLPHSIFGGGPWGVNS